MDKLIDVIKEAILEIFPEAGDMAIECNTRLGDIPEWDSMNAVNLQTYLEKRYPVSIPLELLTDDITLEELMRFVERNMKKHKDEKLLADS
jgi:acyl carrier protein